MRILFVGDTVGRPGRKMFSHALPRLRRLYGPFDFVIVNGENSTSVGRGMTKHSMDELTAAGADGFTSGNHIWDRREFLPFLDTEPRVVRPLNYPNGVPGRGWAKLINRDGKKLIIVSLQGRVFMPATDNPFVRVDELLSELTSGSESGVPVFVDFHAETTSEKKFMGHYLDGRVVAMVGTHTHVPTADAQILPGGTAYITDVGMTGSWDSSIGMTWDSVAPTFLTALPSRYEVAKDDLRLCGVVVDIDDEMNRAVNIKSVITAEGEFDDSW